MNYTKPNNENHKDDPNDWLFGSLTFSFALNHLIPQNHGIIIDLKGDALELHPSAKRVIVFNDGEMMSIMDADERTDLKDGDLVLMINEDNIIN